MFKKTLILFLLPFILLVGCQKENNAFFQTGMYSHNDKVITFLDNNEYEKDGKKGKWTQNENIIYTEDEEYIINRNSIYLDGEKLKRTDFIIGTYKSDTSDSFFVFNDDKTYTYITNENEYAGTWAIDKNKITIDKQYVFTIYNNIIQYDNSGSFYDIKENEGFILEPKVMEDGIYVMSDHGIDLNDFFPDIESFSFVSKSTKNNISSEESFDNILLLVRDNGMLTKFTIDENYIFINQSDGRDEAEIEIVKKDGRKELFTIIYDCNCN